MCSVSGVSGSVSGSGLCDPLLCSCHANTANCSYRGFLSLPSGLQLDLKSLGERQQSSYLIAINWDHF